MSRMVCRAKPSKQSYFFFSCFSAGSAPSSPSTSFFALLDDFGSAGTSATTAAAFHGLLFLDAQRHHVRQHAIAIVSS